MTGSCGTDRLASTKDPYVSPCIVNIIYLFTLERKEITI